MSEKQKYRLASLLMSFGAVVSAGWGVVSILGLFDVVAYSARWYEVVRAFGPMGMFVFAMGGLLCRWDLRGMRERIQAEE